MMLWMLACKGVDPAPAELDDLFHWFWEGYDTADEETFAGGLVNLNAAIGGDTFTEPTDGELTRLSAEEAALVGVTEDPQEAVGLYLLNAFECEWDTLREVLSHPDQDTLYEGTYERYDRTFDEATPREEWLSRSIPRTDYGYEYDSDVLGTQMTVVARGAFRTIAAVDEEVSPYGEFLVQRSYMPEPATFEEGSDKSQDQDYQLEIYWENAGKILHAYGLWREADYGFASSEDVASQRILLNALFDWDDTTALNCASGVP
jgi:hypothetical protein